MGTMFSGQVQRRSARDLYPAPPSRGDLPPLQTPRRLTQSYILVCRFSRVRPRPHQHSVSEKSAFCISRASAFRVDMDANGLSVYGDGVSTLEMLGFLELVVLIQVEPDIVVVVQSIMIVLLEGNGGYYFAVEVDGGATVADGIKPKVGLAVVAVSPLPDSVGAFDGFTGGQDDVNVKVNVE